MMQTRTPNERRNRSGGTLTELMVAVVIMSIGLLGLFGSFRFISRSLHVSRAQSLATNLAQERVETLKNLSYYSLLITTSPANDTDFSPAIPYDTANYPPEKIAIGGITFTRYTYVTMADVTNGNVVALAYTYPDTGMKQIAVTVVWDDMAAKKKWQLTNLLENPNINPLDATIAGNVKVAGTATNLAGSVIKVEQNQDWTSVTDGSGNYSFRVYHGTYTVRASSSGYYDAITPLTSISRGANVTLNLTQQAIATGTVAGIAWYNSGLVISQAVAATNTFINGGGTTQDVEYFELFNPTTYPINIGDNTATYPKALSVYYFDEDPGHNRNTACGGASPCTSVTYVSTYVPSGNYYLFANVASLFIDGQWITADAHYPDADVIRDDKAGGLVLYRPATATILDYVGWDDNNNTAPVYETQSVPCNGGDDGLGSPKGKQIVRVSSPAASAADVGIYGRAYDSNNNRKDFLYESAGFTGFAYRPHNVAAGAFPIIAGKVPGLWPATSGAYVSASDPNSGSTQTYVAYVTSGALTLPYAPFRLVGVTTGTWNIAFGYGAYSQVVANVAVNQGQATPIPNAATTPAWTAANLYHVPLSSTTDMGFVKGIVTDPNNVPIPNIYVQSGGDQKLTGANGTYFMAVSSGTINLTANPGNQNPSYVLAQLPVAVPQGGTTTQDFTLSMGGRLTGYCTTGTTPVANIAISVLNGGSEAGSGTTDASGIFTIKNISSGTFTVAPVLEVGQDANPNNFTTVLGGASTVFVGTFTISGAFGSIGGTVSDASGLITSGALLIASTAAISSTPPSIAASSSPALTPYYMVSSKADGSYVLPVRGGMTYNLSAYVPVVAANGTVSITTKTYSGIAVSVSAATAKNVTIP